jgi:hypothetical protein
MQFMAIVSGAGTPALARLDRHLAAAGAPGLAVPLAPGPAVELALAPGSVRATPFDAAPGGIAGFRVFEAASRAAALALLEGWAGAQDDDVTLELRESGCPGGCPMVLTDAAGAGERYALLLRSCALTESDGVPPRAVLDTLNAFNAAQAAAGVLLAGDGLKSTARGARVKAAGKGGATRAAVYDGPFTEAKELIAGFWMIRAASLDAAVAWAGRLPYPTGPYVGVIVRPVAREVEAQAGAQAEAPAVLTPALAQADESLRTEQLDALLRAELAARPSWG